MPPCLAFVACSTTGCGGLETRLAKVSLTYSIAETFFVVTYLVEQYTPFAVYIHTCRWSDKGFWYVYTWRCTWYLHMIQCKVRTFIAVLIKIATRPRLYGKMKNYWSSWTLDTRDIWILIHVSAESSQGINQTDGTSQSAPEYCNLGLTTMSSD